MNNVCNEHFKMLDMFVESCGDVHDISWYARIDKKGLLVISVSVDEENYFLRIKPEMLGVSVLETFLKRIEIQSQWEPELKKTNPVVLSFVKPTVSRIYCNDCECRYSETHMYHPVCPVCGGTDVVVQQTRGWTHEDVLASYAVVHPLPEKTLKKESQCRH
jgi:hypothetical protein